MTDETRLSHIDEQGRAQMVDVGAKADTERVAVAAGAVLMRPETLRLIQAEALPKGDVLAVARVAGIMAAKRTYELIPMCHPLLLTHIQIDFRLSEAASDAADADAVIHITGTVKTRGKTGVEMEALTAVSVAALTVYDMAKAVDKRMRIHAVRLVEKHGGKSGDLVLE